MTNFDVTTHNATEIVGTFSGTLTDNSGTPVQISGSFDCNK